MHEMETNMSSKLYLTASQVTKRFSISRVTLWNWIKDTDMGFPQPIVIKRIRYFDGDEIEAFEIKLKAKRNIAA